MINVAELMSDPDFIKNRKPFTVVRSGSGMWTNGRFEVITQNIPMVAIIIPEKTRVMGQTPQGDQVSGTINIYSEDQLYETQVANTTKQEIRLSDEIIWHGDNWKIDVVEDYSDFGFYHAIAVRKLGA